MRKSIDASMAALGLDHVDVLQLHSVSSKAGVMDKACRDVLAEAKQQGKTRFIGITCHQNEADVLNALADDPDKFFDVVLVGYNFNSKPGVKEAIARVAKAGMGVIAMKTQAGGYKTKALGDVSPHQAALKFVLQNPHVTAAIPAMVDLKQVKEDLAVMNMKFTQADLDILKRYQLATADVYCHRCGACTHSCRANLDIAHINRSLMYADGLWRSGIGPFNLCGTRARDEGERMRRLRRMHRPLRERFEHCRTHAAGKGSVWIKASSRPRPGDGQACGIACAATGRDCWTTGRSRRRVGGCNTSNAADRSGVGGVATFGAAWLSLWRGLVAAAHGKAIRPPIQPACPRSAAPLASGGIRLEPKKTPDPFYPLVKITQTAIIGACPRNPPQSETSTRRILCYGAQLPNLSHVRKVTLLLLLLTAACHGGANPTTGIAAINAEGRLAAGCTRRFRAGRWSRRHPRLRRCLGREEIPSGLPPDIRSLIEKNLLARPGGTSKGGQESRDVRATSPPRDSIPDSPGRRL